MYTIAHVCRHIDTCSGGLAGLAEADDLVAEMVRLATTL